MDYMYYFNFLTLEIQLEWGPFGRSVNPIQNKGGGGADYAPGFNFHLCTYYIIEKSLLCTPFCTAMESDNMYIVPI